MKQAKTKKSIKPKVSKGTNVRLSQDGYTTIKNYCDSVGYKIGAFVETSSIKRILLESGKA